MGDANTLHSPCAQHDFTEADPAAVFNLTHITIATAAGTLAPTIHFAFSSIPKRYHA